MRRNNDVHGIVRRGLAVCLAAAACVVAAPMSGSPVNAASAAGNSVRVVRVVDGDTVDVRGAAGTFRVRLLNVDTPERGSCLAGAATRFTSRMLPRGATATLRYDQERHDRYGRVLAWVEKGGVAVSAELARAGLGVPMLIRPNARHYASVVAAANEAQSRGVGMFDPTIGCTPARAFSSATWRANQAAAAPVATQTQYGIVLASLAAADLTVHRVRPGRYGLTGFYFRQYLRASKAAVGVLLGRTRSTKAAERGTYVVTYVPPTPTPAPTPGSGSTNPGGYTGPRCYEPGGVRWHPC